MLLSRDGGFLKLVNELTQIQKINKWKNEIRFNLFLLKRVKY